MKVLKKLTNGILDTKMKNKTKIYIGGTFDLFHKGHIELLKKAKKKADIVIVSLNTDEFNERYKGKKPIMTLDERIAVVSACKYVDIVDVNDGGEDSTPAILRHKPDYILHGDDWKGEALMKQMGLTRKFMKKHKIKFMYVPYTKGISTTELKKRIDLYKKFNEIAPYSFFKKTIKKILPSILKNDQT